MKEDVKGYFVSTDSNLLDFEFVFNYLARESYWAKNIPVGTLKTALENSLCFGVYSTEKRQVGFGRVVSDYATYGYLADVFVDPAFRGKGLSKLLMKEIMVHPRLQGLRRMSLMTRDAHELYRQFGWGASKTPEYYMEIKKENPYGAS